MFHLIYHTFSSFLSQAPRKDRKTSEVYTAKKISLIRLVSFKPLCLMNSSTITVSMLGKTFSRQEFEIFFFTFPRKKGFGISCKLWCLRRQLAWNIVIYFLGKIRKNIMCLTMLHLAFWVKFSVATIEIFFLFLPENRIRHCMQTLEAYTKFQSYFLRNIKI